MKRVLVLVLILGLTISTFTTYRAAAAAQDFSDTQGHWAKSYIDRLAASEYISGYPDNTFRPDKTMSRAEFVLILINCLGATPTDTSTKSFSDTANHWAVGYINEAVKRGIFVPSEYPGGLKPDGPIKRSEAAAALVRAVGGVAQDTASTFKDNANIEKSMYKGFIKAAVKDGLMSGFDDNTFRPFDNITRAQAAVIFCHYLDKKGDSSSTPLTPGLTGIVIDPDTDNLETVKINDVEYEIGVDSISFKNESSTARVNVLSKYSDGLLLNYSTRYSLSPTGLEILVDNVRYGVSEMEISGKELVVTPSYCKLAYISEYGSKYNAEFTDLYISDASHKYLLSDMEIVDQKTVEIDGESYKIRTGEVIIKLEDNEYYTIEGISIEDDGVTLDLDETSPLEVEDLRKSDIASIEVGSNEMDLDDISQISFIIDSKLYSLSKVTVDNTGRMIVSGEQYSPSAVVMVVDDSLYDLDELEINRSGKLEIYCDDSDREFVEVDERYLDKEDVEIVYDDEEYEVDEVLVVKKYIVRLGSKQYDVRNYGFECKYDGDNYDIKKIDWDEDMDITVIVTEEGIGNVSDDDDVIEPDEYLFYIDGTICQDGMDGIEIEVDDTWRDFDEIELKSGTDYSYSDSSYGLLGAKIRIDGDEYEIDDTSWNSGTKVLKIYLVES